jgi:hypothetical protein
MVAKRKAPSTAPARNQTLVIQFAQLFSFHLAKYLVVCERVVSRKTLLQVEKSAVLFTTVLGKEKQY